MIYARGSVICVHENIGSDGIGVLFDLRHSTPLVGLILLNTASVGQPQHVEDATHG